MSRLSEIEAPRCKKCGTELLQAGAWGYSNLPTCDACGAPLHAQPPQAPALHDPTAHECPARRWKMCCPYPSVCRDQEKCVDGQVPQDEMHVPTAQAPARGEAPPNNRVACVNCKQPVDVTALNAIRCDRCKPEARPTEPSAAAIEAAARAWVKRRGDVAWTDLEDLPEWFDHARCALIAAYAVDFGPPPQPPEAKP